MSKPYLPIPDEKCLTKAHHTATPWAQWEDNCWSLRATRGATAASSAHLDAVVPNGVITEVGRWYWYAHPDETHVACRVTWGSRGAMIGNTVDWRIITTDTTAAPALTATSATVTDRLPYQPGRGARSSTVRLGYPGHYEAAEPIYSQTIVLAHAAALPRDRVLIVQALCWNGWAGVDLRLQGIWAYGLRVD